MKITVYYTTEFGIKSSRIKLEKLPSFSNKFKIVRIEYNEINK